MIITDYDPLGSPCLSACESAVPQPYRHRARLPQKAVLVLVLVLALVLRLLPPNCARLVLL